VRLNGRHETLFTTIPVPRVPERVQSFPPRSVRTDERAPPDERTYLEYDDPDGDSDELGMGKPGDARLGLTFGHWCPGGGVLDAAVSASDHILGLVGGNGMPQS